MTNGGHLPPVHNGWNIVSSVSLESFGFELKTQLGWFEQRTFTAFLNGCNGEWTNTDDIDDAGNAERKRRNKEAATNKHRTEPGKFKGKGGPRGGGGRGGAGRGDSSGRYNEHGHLTMGGGRGHGRMSADNPIYKSLEAKMRTCTREDAAPSGPIDEDVMNAYIRRMTGNPAAVWGGEGKPSKPGNATTRPKRMPPGVLPASDDEDEETEKPRAKTDSEDDEPVYWYDQAMHEAREELSSELKQMVKEEFLVTGQIVPEPEFEDDVDLAMARDRSMRFRNELLARKKAATLLGKIADQSALAHVNSVFTVEREVVMEGQVEIRRRMKERQLAAYLAEHDPEPPVIPVDKLPQTAMRTIPLASDEPLCCSTDWFANILPTLFRTFGWYERRYRQEIQGVNPDLEGDAVEMHSHYLAVDDDTAWHVKLGYRRTYDGLVYPELADFLIKEYLPTAMYTENVLSRMHYDSVKWYEDQNFTAPAHLALTTNTINWVVVQNQVARARSSSRLVLGSTVVPKVPWK